MNALREVCARENVPDCIVLVIEEYCDTYNVLEKKTRVNAIIRKGYAVWKKFTFLDELRTTEYQMKCHVWMPVSASMRHRANTQKTYCVDPAQWCTFIMSFYHVEDDTSWDFWPCTKNFQFPSVEVVNTQCSSLRQCPDMHILYVNVSRSPTHSQDWYVNLQGETKYIILVTQWFVLDRSGTRQCPTPWDVFGD